MLVAIAMLVSAAGSAIQGAPSDAEVLRAMPPATRGLPFVIGEFRDDVVIVKNLVRQKVAGPFGTGETAVNVITTHWECAAHYTRTVQLGFPFDAAVKKKCVQVVYIDKSTIEPDAKK